MMAVEKTLAELLQEILKEDPRAAIILGEILGPPIGLGTSPSHLWEDPGEG